MTYVAVLELLVIAGLGFALYQSQKDHARERTQTLHRMAGERNDLLARSAQDRQDSDSALIALIEQTAQERQTLLDRIQRPERPVGPEPVTMVLPEPEPDEYEQVGTIAPFVDDVELVGQVE